ncbi:uncharacterized protein G2W53_006291 [Senna tora]|uniref:Uncharacterized protein n=1 Tax=Senna tora TaxID=362788 RepID=A0A835CCU9_9FABA|nr:uncharacterized protein G2W53_006291 [Senna tora]
MGEKRSRARLRDLKLSFFSDCGSTGSKSTVGPGIFEPQCLGSATRFSALFLLHSFGDGRA